MRVGEYHTYFVGREDWEFSVWAHNACFEVGPFNELEVEEGLHRHHVPQTIAGLESISEFTRESGPAIKIPEWMHQEIEHLTLNEYIYTQGGNILTHINWHLAQLKNRGVPQNVLDDLRTAIMWWIG